MSPSQNLRQTTSTFCYKKEKGICLSLIMLVICRVNMECNLVIVLYIFRVDYIATFDSLENTIFIDYVSSIHNIFFTKHYHKLNCFILPFFVGA